VKFFIKFVYVVALLFAIGSVVAVISGIFGGGGDNVMQQTGAIAFSIGLAVIPYCIARAIEKLFS